MYIYTVGLDLYIEHISAKLAIWRRPGRRVVLASLYLASLIVKLKLKTNTRRHSGSQKNYCQNILLIFSMLRVARIRYYF